ncbi:hypothetical protein C8J57DRAFT_1356783 [Mycena rebaudengoi]|nr:hypothetical protein C8J57DRAFT_1356783 [Mycena rebaudengoi]
MIKRAAARRRAPRRHARSSPRRIIRTAGDDDRYSGTTSESLDDRPNDTLVHRASGPTASPEWAGLGVSSPGRIDGVWVCVNVFSTTTNPGGVAIDALREDDGDPALRLKAEDGVAVEDPCLGRGRGRGRYLRAGVSRSRRLCSCSTTPGVINL